mmetsp:Transcript_65680/g.172105  ORF Transcript_65680/g.172105 Transcript_65680/m.172105 type:complete len:343 (+) Transcript_65680:69-1097(+)
MAAFVQSYGLQLVRCSGGPFDAKQLTSADVIAFYFSAHWCPPCRQFTPMLKKFVETLQSNGEFSLKVICVSSDHAEHEMWKYIYDCHGDWLALAFPDRAMKDRLSQQYQVSGIPQLVVIDQVGRNVVGNARNDVMSAANSSSTQVLTSYLSWKMASGAAGGPATPLSQPGALKQDACGKLTPGVRVKIYGLVSAPEHNGSEGVIKGYDAGKQRYLVELGEKSLSLRASSLLQLLRVQTQGVEGQADVVEVDAETGELVLRRLSCPEGEESSRAKLGDADGPVLPAGAVVAVQGLQAESAKKYNEQTATIVEYDAEAGRYLIQVTPSAQIKVKAANIRFFPLC